MSAAMIKRLFITYLLFFVTTTASAITVNTQAGMLHTAVNDSSITSLTVTGTLDARDFKFIAEELLDLVSLDMCEVTIVEYNATEDDNLFGDNLYFKAATIPMCALAGLTSLQNVTLPANLEAIDYAAFAGCKELKDISFPATLKSIGDEAFNTCRGLTSINIGGQITKIGKGCFARCHYITSVVINPQNPLIIGDNAFLDCTRLSSVQIGPMVTSIGDGAFNGCIQLNGINIMDGSKLTDIGDQAFYKTSLRSFDFNATPLLSHLGAWSMANTKLTSITLPSHVKSLDEGVFFYDSRLTSLSLPKNLSYLPDYMLTGCEKLTSTAFLIQNLGSIGDYALYNQSQQSTVKLPFKVYYIGTQAMAGMTGLRSITSEPLEVPELGDDVWAGVNKSQVTLYVNETSLDLYQTALQWKDFFISVAQLRGDVNSDGFVNTSDVSGERTYIVDGNSDGINIDFTDVNEDENVDVADITSIYNIINGTEPAAQPTRRRCKDYILGNGTLFSNHKAVLEIGIENTSNYTSFQMSITPPSHILITGVKTTGRCVGHEVYITKRGNTYLLVGYSPANDDIEGYEGPIITLDIESSQDIKQEEIIELTDIYFVDYQENVYIMGQTQLNALGSSSLDTIQVTDEPSIVNVYNTQGQLVRINVDRANATSGLPAGIYIVGGKKVIVR